MVYSCAGLEVTNPVRSLLSSKERKYEQQTCTFFKFKNIAEIHLGCSCKYILFSALRLFTVWAKRLTFKQPGPFSGKILKIYQSCTLCFVLTFSTIHYFRSYRSTTETEPMVCIFQKLSRTTVNI